MAAVAAVVPNAVKDAPGCATGVPAQAISVVGKGETGLLVQNRRPNVRRAAETAASRSVIQ